MNFGFYLLFLVPTVLIALWAGYLLLTRKPNDQIPENSRADATEPRGMTGPEQQRHHHTA